MKEIIIVCSILLFSINGLSQDYFTVAGKKYAIDSKTNTYRYSYSLKADAFHIALIDSTEIVKNNLNAISVITKHTQKDKRGSYQEIYVNHVGLDSIRKWYENNNLIKEEELKYDSYHRLSKSFLKDLQNPKNSGECMYIHIDSLTNEGKTNTMIAFKTYAKMLNGYDYEIKTYYDIHGDTLRQIRIDKYGETTILNKYNTSRRDRKEINYTEEVVIDTCDLENKQQLITKYLTLVESKIKDPKYISLDYDFYNQDKSIQLYIKKNRRNNFQQAIITVKKK